MPEQTSAAPVGCTTVVPSVVTDGARAFLDFVAQAFGGEELGLVSTEDGLIGHGGIRVGDTDAKRVQSGSSGQTGPSHTGA